MYEAAEWSREWEDEREEGGWEFALYSYMEISEVVSIAA